MKLTNNFWIAAFLVFLFDLSTKVWALNFLPFDEEYMINKFLSIHRIYNEGTIMLNYSLPFNLTVDQFRFFWVIMALTITFSIYWVSKQKALQEKTIETEFIKTGLFLLIGSIWGNAFDRVFRPEGVIDFIRLNFVDSIPILNIADIMVYLANVCFIIAWGIVLYKHLNKNQLLLKS